jgi:hypothetical protein
LQAQYWDRTRGSWNEFRAGAFSRRSRFIENLTLSNGSYCGANSIWNRTLAASVTERRSGRPFTFIFASR